LPPVDPETTFSLISIRAHDLNPVSGCILPDSVAQVFRRILLLLGRHPHILGGPRHRNLSASYIARVVDDMVLLQTESFPLSDHPPAAEKLRRASPHWMRPTHASHALARGAELTTVRDNLRHASIATTSIYLQSDEVKRARQMNQAFAAR
jgi:integrase